MAPIPHDRYYLKDGVTFLVENTLFRVPRYMLENTSPVFKTMLADVKPDTAPIPLPNITSTDFEHLLQFLYPLTPHPVDAFWTPLDEDQWIAILRVATIWEMTDIRTAAIQILSGIFKRFSPISQICLGREHGIPSWIKEGFIILCLQPSPLRAEEAVQLTKDDVIAYAAAREEIRRRVLEREGKRKVGWVHPSRLSGERGMESYGLLAWAHSRMVRRIVSSAFGFEDEGLSDKDSDDEDVAEPGNDTSTWWPLPTIKSPHIPHIPHILQFVKSGNDQGDRRSDAGSIKDIKDIPHFASSLTIANIEKHWIRSRFYEDFLKHLTPLSFSAIALSTLGILILIPRALT